MPSIPPAGVTPLAAFTLVEHTPTPPPPAIVADAIGSRSRDVQSLTRSAPIADGMVSYLIGIQRGSGAAVRRFGQRFREVRHVDPGAATTLESMARECVQPAVDTGTIRLTRVEVEPNPTDRTQVDGFIEFRDLLERRRSADRRLTLQDGEVR